MISRPIRAHSQDKVWCLNYGTCSKIRDWRYRHYGTATKTLALSIHLQSIASVWGTLYWGTAADQTYGTLLLSDVWHGVSVLDPRLGNDC